MLTSRHNLTIETIVLGDLSTNCYIVWKEPQAQAVVIDPADNAQTIIDFLLQKGLSLWGILLTHGHFDHVLGLLELQTAFGVPSYMHSADAQLLSQAASSAKHWLRRTVDPVPPATHFLKHGQTLHIGDNDGFELTVHHTPGHTPGSIALTTPGLAFVGDTLFAEGVGRTDFSYSDEKKLWQSIEYLHKNLDPQTILLSGHGEEGILKYAPQKTDYT